ncbi:MAG: MotA/TolQ/ExbB proton channel family protein [Cyclobacteriaceae bacterium]
MFQFLKAGGLSITLPMTLLLIVAIGVMLKSMMAKSDLPEEKMRTQISYVKYLGILSLTIGLFGQVLGLYNALSAIEAMGNVAPAMVYGGIRVSSISTIYGFSIFLICYTAWLVLKVKTDRTYQQG